MIRLITPSLPAVSRPSNTTTSRLPFATIHSCMWTSSVWSLSSSFSYSRGVSSIAGTLEAPPERLDRPCSGRDSRGGAIQASLDALAEERDVILVADQRR